jgi:kinesin family protein 1
MLQICTPSFLFPFNTQNNFIIANALTHCVIFVVVADIVNPKVPPGSKDATKSFNYDYSYWSHDVSCYRNNAQFTSFTKILISLTVKIYIPSM